LRSSGAVEAQPAPARPGRAAGFLTGPFSALLQHRALLRRTVPDALRKRYAGQAMGIFWLVLSPLLLMSIYAAIYVLVFRIRPVAMSQAEYVLYIFAGLIPFLGFSEALNSGTTSLSVDRTVLLNTVFPPELLPLQACIASHATTLVGLAMVTLLAAAIGTLGPLALLVPVVLLLQVMFVAGLVWVLSLASLVLRDIQQILTFVVMALLVLTPIAYTLDMVPRAVAPLVYANPLSYFVILFHDLLVFGRLPPWPIAAAAAALSLLSFCAGYWAFQRVKLVFFDYA
jgi:homopolymeric O-antigen transport system permease protein